MKSDLPARKVCGERCFARSGWKVFPGNFPRAWPAWKLHGSVTGTPASNPHHGAHPCPPRPRHSTSLPVSTIPTEISPAPRSEATVRVYCRSKPQLSEGGRLLQYRAARSISAAAGCWRSSVGPGERCLSRWRGFWTGQEVAVAGPGPRHDQQATRYTLWICSTRFRRRGGLFWTAATGQKKPRLADPRERPRRLGDGTDRAVAGGGDQSPADAALSMVDRGFLGDLDCLLSGHRRAVPGPASLSPLGACRAMCSPFPRSSPRTTRSPVVLPDWIAEKMQRPAGDWRPAICFGPIPFRFKQLHERYTEDILKPAGLPTTRRHKFHALAEIVIDAGPDFVRHGSRPRTGRHFSRPGLTLERYISRAVVKQQIGSPGFNVPHSDVAVETLLRIETGARTHPRLVVAHAPRFFFPCEPSAGRGVRNGADSGFLLDPPLFGLSPNAIPPPRSAAPRRNSCIEPSPGLRQGGLPHSIRGWKLRKFSSSPRNGCRAGSHRRMTGRP